MENRILVPIDFEQQSLLNLEWAKYYASFNNAQVFLLHIIEETGFLKRIFKQANFDKKLIEDSKNKLQQIAQNNFSDSKLYNFNVQKGKPYEEIEDFAEELNPEMIIVGKNDDSSLNKKYIGSNTLHLINETDYPVVTIFGNNKPAEAQKVILLPVDITKSYEEQITVAFEYAKLFGASIKAISVNFQETVSGNVNLLTRMNKIKSFFEKNNIQIETEIVKGTKEEIGDIINDFAKKLNPILTIIMLREESNFKNFFIGSVAQEIINNNSAPVLSVKPWDKESEINPVFDVLVNPFDIYE